MPRTDENGFNRLRWHFGFLRAHGYRALRLSFVILFATVGLALAVGMVATIAWSIAEWFYIFFPRAFAFVGRRVPY